MNAPYRRRSPSDKFPIASVSPMPALPADAIAAARAMCDEYEGGVRQGGGVPAVAAKLGMQPQVLYNKLGGDEDSHHKLTVADFIRVWLVTRRIDHLQALARTLNCVCFPVPDYSGLSDQALLDLICAVNEEGGHFHAATKAALADGRVDAEEAALIRSEAYQWIAAIAEALARVEGIARV